MEVLDDELGGYALRIISITLLNQTHNVIGKEKVCGNHCRSVVELLSVPFGD